MTSLLLANQNYCLQKQMKIEHKFSTRRNALYTSKEICRSILPIFDRQQSELFFQLLLFTENLMRANSKLTSTPNSTLLTFSYISFSYFTSPVHPTGFSFCFFPGFLAIFILLSSSNNNSFFLDTVNCHISTGS